MDQVGATERDLDRAAGGKTAVAAPPWWALASAIMTPLALIGGWLYAGELQGGGYDAVDQSVSFLAGYGARDRYLMTAALVVVGCSHILTACGLRGVRPTARWLLALGGTTGILVAALPEPDGGSTLEHVVAASIGAVLLTMWAAFVGSNHYSWPSPLSVGVSAIATAAIAFSVLVLFAAAQAGTGLGLTERICTALQALWPLVIVLALRRRSLRMATLSVITRRGEESP